MSYDALASDLVVEAHVDHDHFPHHADPAGATGIVGVHPSPEPHLRERGRETAKIDTGHRTKIKERLSCRYMTNSVIKQFGNSLIS